MVGAWRHFDWERQWAPLGAAPGEPGRPLESYSSAECALLVADAGLGKSEELARHAQLLEAAGYRVHSEDLGAFSTSEELRAFVFDAIPASGDRPIAVLLDSLDEAKVNNSRIVDLLVRYLRTLPDGALVRIATRPNSLSERLRGFLQETFPTYCELELKPLGDEEFAAVVSHLAGGDEFALKARALRASELIRRPVTLRLLAELWTDGEKLPTSRSELYEQGLTALVTPPPVRQERKTAGPPSAALIEVAEELATYSLLSGATSLTAIEREPREPGVLTTTEVSDIQADHVDFALGTALFATSDNDKVRWTHRTFEEFLAARRLARLPASTIARLLTTADDTTKLIPQLTDTALLVCATVPEFFDWVVTNEPGVLFDSGHIDLDDSQRRRIAESLMSVWRSGSATNRRRFEGLAYPGIGSGLVAIAADTNLPDAPRREALIAVWANDVRDADADLASLVETGCRPSATPSDSATARYAAFALEGTTNIPVIDRVLTALTADTDAQVADQILTSLPTTSLTTAELLTKLGRSTFIGTDLARTVTRLIRGRLEAASPQEIQDIAVWLRAKTPGIYNDHDYAGIQAAIVEAVLRNYSDSALLDVVGEWISSRIDTEHQFFADHGQPVIAGSKAARIALVRATLVAAPEQDRWYVTSRLAEMGLIQANDFISWIDEWVAASDPADPAVLDACKAALDAAARPGDDAQISAAQQHAAGNEAASELVASIFSKERRAAFAEHRRRQVEYDAARLAREAADSFSQVRLELALNEDKWIAVVDELAKGARAEPGNRDGFTDITTSETWGWLGSAVREKCGSLALDFLRDAPEVGCKLSGSIASYAAASLDVALAADIEQVDSLDPGLWSRWLPTLVDTPNSGRLCGKAIRGAAAHDPDELAEQILRLVRPYAESPGRSAPVLDKLDGYMTEDLLRELIAVAAHPAANEWVLGQVLALGLPDDPAAAALALDVISARPPQRPKRPSDDQPASPDAAAWDRAIVAGCALGLLSGSDAHLGAVVNAFTGNVEFAEDLIDKASYHDRDAFLAGLNLEAHRDLYIWCRENLRQPPPPDSGGVQSLDFVAEYRNAVLGRITSQRTFDAARVLAELSIRYPHEPWWTALANEARRSARAASWTPLAPAEIAQVLKDPFRRDLQTEAQLRDAILEALERVQADIKSNTGTRARFWHRQDGTARGYIRSNENEASDQIRDLLRDQLSSMAYVAREVDLQPRLGDEPGERADFTVTVTNPQGTVTVVVEAKGTWHPKVKISIEDQLARGYLQRGETLTGVYLVYSFEQADRDRSKAEMLGEELARRSVGLSVDGLSVTAVVLSIPLALDKRVDRGLLHDDTEEA